jgi:hypothetical protein
MHVYVAPQRDLIAQCITVVISIHLTDAGFEWARTELQLRYTSTSESLSLRPKYLTVKV